MIFPYSIALYAKPYLLGLSALSCAFFLFSACFAFFLSAFVIFFPSLFRLNELESAWYSLQGYD